MAVFCGAAARNGFRGWLEPAALGSALAPAARFGGATFFGAALPERFKALAALGAVLRRGALAGRFAFASAVAVLRAVFFLREVCLETAFLETVLDALRDEPFRALVRLRP